MSDTQTFLLDCKQESESERERNIFFLIEFHYAAILLPQSPIARTTRVSYCTRLELVGPDNEPCFPCGPSLVQQCPTTCSIAGTSSLQLIYFLSLDSVIGGPAIGVSGLPRTRLLDPVA